MLRTKSQRRKLCPKCPVARVADLFGDSCSLLIMRDLLKGMRRFGELEESLGGMSPRTLTKKLRKLESEGFIKRRGYGEPRLERLCVPTGQVELSCASGGNRTPALCLGSTCSATKLHSHVWEVYPVGIAKQFPAGQSFYH